jgi:hypothetical protein
MYVCTRAGKMVGVQVVMNRRVTSCSVPKLFPAPAMGSFKQSPTLCNRVLKDTATYLSTMFITGHRFLFRQPDKPTPKTDIYLLSLPHQDRMGMWEA